LERKGFIILCTVNDSKVILPNLCVYSLQHVRLSYVIKGFIYLLTITQYRLILYEIPRVGYALFLLTNKFFL